MMMALTTEWKFSCNASRKIEWLKMMGPSSWIVLTLERMWAIVCSGSLKSGGKSVELILTRRDGGEEIDERG
jgi:hypothetical protein